MLRIDWTQHAAGHGGFHVGRALVGEPGAPAVPFTWIFDCGSRANTKLDEYLKAWARTQKHPIDWLFLSHFDKDHVSGLEELLSRIEVQDVMVPYVNVAELGITLLEEIEHDRLHRWFVELVADPASWLLARGVQRVTFLRGDGDIGGGEDPVATGPRDEGRPQGWSQKIKPPPQVMQMVEALDHVEPNAAIAEVTGPCEIVCRRGNYALRLLPYCQAISASAHTALLADLGALVGTASTLSTRPGLGDLAHRIATHARSETGRKSLRTLFKRHVGSSNRASLSLLSVPVPRVDAGQWVTLTSGMERGWGRGSGPAWINTGDAELLHASALKAWQAHYASELANVRVMALPHHGSDHNSDGAFQALAPSATLVAHVKDGAKKHPGRDVAETAGERLACVTGERSTEVRMIYWD